MKNMRTIIVILVLILAVVAGYYFGSKDEENLETNESREPIVYNDKIKLENPLDGDTIESPLVIEGEARGNWFFEASFPVILTDWDGRIIAQHYASAEGEWMTGEYVPFKSTLEFESPYKEGDPDFIKRGTLILRKDNPSGLAEHDDALEITVFFE